MATTRPVRRIAQTLETRALVLGRTQVGDADLLLQLFTEARGLLTVAARSARRASSRLGALEPMHTLRVKVSLAEGRDIGTLRESVVSGPRTALLESEERMMAALDLLRGLKRLLLPAAADPDLFGLVEGALDRLADAPDVPRSALHAKTRLADALGFSLSFDACVRCGKRCPDGAAALVEPNEGGLVCRACGGGRVRLSAEERRQCSAFLGDPSVSLDHALFATLTEVVEAVLRSHGVLDRR